MKMHENSSELRKQYQWNSDTPHGLPPYIQHLSANMIPPDANGGLSMQQQAMAWEISQRMIQEGQLL